jgi:hypothetical protein
MEKKVDELEVAESDFVFVEARESGKGWNLNGDGAPTIDKCEYCSKYDSLPVKCGCKKVDHIRIWSDLLGCLLL